MERCSGKGTEARDEEKPNACKKTSIIQGVNKTEVNQQERHGRYNQLRAGEASSGPSPFPSSLRRYWRTVFQGWRSYSSVSLVQKDKQVTWEEPASPVFSSCNSQLCRKAAQEKGVPVRSWHVL